MIISGLKNKKGLWFIFLTSKKVFKILNQYKLNPSENLFGGKKLF